MSHPFFFALYFILLYSLVKLKFWNYNKNNIVYPTQLSTFRLPPQKAGGLRGAGVNGAKNTGGGGGATGNEQTGGVGAGGTGGSGIAVIRNARS